MIARCRSAAARSSWRPGGTCFVVDCRLAETGSTTRFALEAEVEAGGQYRLEAEATAVGCERVELRRR
jgi:hypothetical protein